MAPKAFHPLDIPKKDSTELEKQQSSLSPNLKQEANDVPGSARVKRSTAFTPPTHLGTVIALMALLSGPVTVLRLKSMCNEKSDQALFDYLRGLGLDLPTYLLPPPTGNILQRHVCMMTPMDRRRVTRWMKRLVGDRG